MYILPCKWSWDSSIFEKYRKRYTNKVSKRNNLMVSSILKYEKYFDTMYGNREAFDYLQANNVNVTLDNDGTTTDHMKLVIIDNEIVYIGSHNWSEAGLSYNHETSVKIVNVNIAEIFKNYSEKI